jgi:hypothetical protein
MLAVIETLVGDMALNQHEQQWIRNEIKSQVKEQSVDHAKALKEALGPVEASLRDVRVDIASIKERTHPTGYGWLRAVAFVKGHGLLPAVFTIAAAVCLGGWAIGVKRIADDNKFQGATDERLKHIESIINKFVLKAASESPEKKSSQEIASDVLSLAKKTQVAIPKEVVSDAGLSFINAAGSNQDAWGVALSFVTYRSSLVRAPEQDAVTSAPQGWTDATFRTQTGKPHPEFSFVPQYVPRDRAALGQFISAQDLPPPLGVLPPVRESSFGPSTIIAKGGSVILDGMRVRRFIFENVEIVYSGAPVELDDVMFVNCTFVFDNQSNSRTLGAFLLASDTVTVHLSRS